MRKHCADCGTLLERNGICPNCDEAACIMDWQGEFVENPSEEFQKEADEGYARAAKRLERK